MTDMLIVYVTCENIGEAKKIGRHLLEKRLCACVNILGNANPMFLWPPKSGNIDESQEVVLLVKTLEKKYSEVEKEIIKMHSYDTPCIIALPVLHVAQKYYEWLKGEIEFTRKGGGKQ
ncbi:TPA: divalent-cation tolerance protein CutA [Patescibacteria group bacterium]|uniref:CutA1 divalent ion tolerance protein n=3 Tax=Candidatus Gottesmaniibacteriota TaxID=1752720 RepID=A0A0G1UQ12_9BACT|nr:MAG: CutA1 divalent ion tolerance protein [Candidatus Gottesmanbacteria bacterium GW2011_GWA2_47_9]KKU96234.1 MAG: CutA1 divalent ion tolerance protein [Candidatus Gottesmanbacteria bacterium GW2011_GWA1_48_13]HCS79383.1 divalent-cation tolerance protein CutA [Patescibacteria group bacterium]